MSDNGAKKAKIDSLLTVQVNDEIPGYSGAVRFPKDPGQWLQDLKKSVEEIGYIQIQLDTLAGGCGGCAIVFSNYGSRDGYNDIDGTDGAEEGKNFGFILSYQEMKSLKKAIDFCLETMEINGEDDTST